MAKAQAAKSTADALAKRVDAAYAAMQTAGVAIQNGQIATAGDTLLRAAGWVDAPAPIPASTGPMPQGLPAQPAPYMPAGPGVGEHSGMETARVTDGRA